MSENVGSNEQTSFSFPYWLVESLDSALRPTSETLQFESQSDRKIKLLPTLNDAELEVLCELISTLQEQILTTPCGPLKISRQLLEMSGARSGQRGGSRRMLELVLSTRIGVASNSAESMKTSWLFADEEWTTDPSDEVSAYVSVPSTAKQLFLGYVEPYSEMTRRWTNNGTAMATACKEQPLLVWRAPWLEMTSLEKGCLLRMEKAMQWGNRWLHLDGVFGDSVSNITGSHNSQPSVSSSKSNPINAKLLQRLGKRLIEQGWMAPDEQLPYLAITGNSAHGIEYVWQITGRRLSDLENCAQESPKLGWMLESVWLEWLNSQRAAVNGGISTQQAAGVATTAKRILARHPEQSRKSMFPCAVGTICCLPLAVEWAARMLPNHGYPLGASVQHSLRSILGMLPSGLDELEDQFESIALSMATNSAALERLMSAPGFSMLTDSVNGNVDFQRFVQRTIANEFQREKPALKANIPTIANEAPLPVQSCADSRPTQAQQDAASLKRIATEELQRMRKQDIGRYDSLKTSYFESLDPTRRRLIEDVRRRMGSETFEQHLKHSLIKFMLDHPSAWKSARVQERSFLGPFAILR